MRNVRIYYCSFNFDCHSNLLLMHVINCACRIFRTCAHVEDFAPRTSAMAISDRQMPNFGSHNKPNQPLQFDFPKLEFGKTRILIPTATPVATPPSQTGLELLPTALHHASMRCQEYDNIQVTSKIYSVLLHSVTQT